MTTHFILGDWGVSACRLYRVEDGQVVECRRGPGIKFTANPADTYREMTADWTRVYGPLHALLCGTVGANIGWRDAGYVPAPAGLPEIVAARVRVPDDAVTILPGISVAENHFGTPDVMRSEDIQALGWCAARERADALLCCPGSHTKWVEVKNGRVARFTTGFVGELFEVLLRHSILVGEADASSPFREDIFLEGVATGARHPAPLSALFEVRARAAQNLERGAASRDRLSGLLVGSDCAAMRHALDRAPDTIIGDGAIAEGYRIALSHLGATVPGPIPVPVYDGETAAIDGLLAASQHISSELSGT